LQIVYADSNPTAAEVLYEEDYPVIDDSKFVPILKMEQAPADVECNVLLRMRSSGTASYMSSLCRTERA
jgi:hypothetical protein